MRRVALPFRRSRTPQIGAPRTMGISSLCCSERRRLSCAVMSPLMLASPTTALGCMSWRGLGVTVGCGFCSREHAVLQGSSR